MVNHFDKNKLFKKTQLFIYYIFNLTLLSQLIFVNKYNIFLIILPIIYVNLISFMVIIKF